MTTPFSIRDIKQILGIDVIEKQNEMMDAMIKQIKEISENHKNILLELQSELSKITKSKV